MGLSWKGQVFEAYDLTGASVTRSGGEFYFNYTKDGVTKSGRIPASQLEVFQKAFNANFSTEFGTVDFSNPTAPFTSVGGNNQQQQQTQNQQTHEEVQEHQADDLPSTPNNKLYKKDRPQIFFTENGGQLTITAEGRTLYDEFKQATTLPPKSNRHSQDGSPILTYPETLHTANHTDEYFKKYSPHKNKILNNNGFDKFTLLAIAKAAAEADAARYAVNIEALERALNQVGPYLRQSGIQHGNTISEDEWKKQWQLMPGNGKDVPFLNRLKELRALIQDTIIENIAHEIKLITAKTPHPSIPSEPNSRKIIDRFNDDIDNNIARAFQKQLNNPNLTGIERHIVEIQYWERFQRNIRSLEVLVDSYSKIHESISNEEKNKLSPTGLPQTVDLSAPENRQIRYARRQRLQGKTKLPHLLFPPLARDMFLSREERASNCGIRAAIFEAINSSAYEVSPTNPNLYILREEFLGKDFGKYSTRDKAISDILEKVRSSVLSGQWTKFNFSRMNALKPWLCIWSRVDETGKRKRPIFTGMVGMLTYGWATAVLIGIPKATRGICDFIAHGPSKTPDPKAPAPSTLKKAGGIAVRLGLAVALPVMGFYAYANRDNLLPETKKPKKAEPENYQSPAQRLRANQQGVKKSTPEKAPEAGKQQGSEVRESDSNYQSPAERAGLKPAKKKTAGAEIKDSDLQFGKKNGTAETPSTLKFGKNDTPAQSVGQPQESRISKALKAIEDGANAPTPVKPTLNQKIELQRAIKESGNKLTPEDKARYDTLKENGFLSKASVQKLDKQEQMMADAATTAQKANEAPVFAKSHETTIKQVIKTQESKGLQTVAVKDSRPLEKQLADLRKPKEKPVNFSDAAKSAAKPAPVKAESHLAAAEQRKNDVINAGNPGRGTV